MALLFWPPSNPLIWSYRDNIYFWGHWYLCFWTRWQSFLQCPVPTKMKEWYAVLWKLTNFGRCSQQEKHIYMGKSVPIYIQQYESELLLNFWSVWFQYFYRLLFFITIWFSHSKARALKWFTSGRSLIRARYITAPGLDVRRFVGIFRKSNSSSSFIL